MNNKPVLITGASGFIGRNLCRCLKDSQVSFRPVVRLPTIKDDDRAVVVEDIHAVTDWSAALRGVTAVVHLASQGSRHAGACSGPSCRIQGS